MTKKYEMLYRCSPNRLPRHQDVMCTLELIPGETLSLRRDKDNRFDPRAIAVDFEGTQIGWIPQAQNEILSRLLDLDIDLTGRVISQEIGNPLDSRLYIGIYILVEVD